MHNVDRIHVIDSHTGGEPTRVVTAGGPDLGVGSVQDRLARLHREQDGFRAAIMNEPRGWDAMVGALVVEPDSADATAGVMFFNNVGPLGMCVHGMIGVAVTLHHQGRLEFGTHQFDTPVGVVDVTMHDENRVSVRNVESFRLAQKVQIELPPHGVVRGDIAWGGNWFFLVDQDDHGQQIELANVERLTNFTWAIRQALHTSGITGDDGAEIDHIELFTEVNTDRAASRNFVLCPGKAYDRSPCGTGTSAKVACLAADGKLLPGETWRQESITGSVFEATYEPSNSGRKESVLPTITGAAFITAESTLILDPNDPFRGGIRS